MGGKPKPPLLGVDKQGSRAVFINIQMKRAEQGTPTLIKTSLPHDLAVKTTQVK